MNKRYDVDYIVKQIGDNTYTFVCDYVNCRDGFSHVCELRKDGYTLNSNRVHYLNRTWESYRYQTAMLGCVRNEMEYIMRKGKQEYKEAHNLSRLVGNSKEEVENAIKCSKEYAELELLYKMVSDARYGTEAEREELESLDRLLKLTEAFVSLMRKEA